MIAGHFAVAAAVKGVEGQVPLWALMLASAWLDVVFIPLFGAGLETIETAPGASGYGSAVIHAHYTHSLVGALLLSALYGGGFALAWGQRAGAVLGGVAFSHWILDLVVHRGDMPILPGNAGDLPLLGLGLWQVPPLVIGIELALVALGSFLYWRAASATAGRDRQGAARLLAMGVFAAGLLVVGLDATGALG